MTNFRSFITDVQFRLRSGFWGEWRLRKGLPSISGDSKSPAEIPYYRLVLERGWGDQDRKAVQWVVDIGCRNWSYIDALADFFPKASLTGVELDGGRRYWNLYRRKDAALAEVKRLRMQGRETTCWFGDFGKLQKLPIEAIGAGVFVFFFPFVSEEPCLQWGLPYRFANYRRLVERCGALRLGHPGPWTILSCHQGEWEAEIASLIYSQLGLAPTSTVLHADEMPEGWPSSIDTHIFRVSDSGAEGKLCD